MPELPVLDENGDLESIALVIVLAVMAFAESQRERGYYFGHLLVLLNKQPGVQVEGLSTLLLALHEAPAPSQIMRRAVEQKRKAQNAAPPVGLEGLSASALLRVNLVITSFYDVATPASEGPRASLD